MNMFFRYTCLVALAGGFTVGCGGESRPKAVSIAEAPKAIENSFNQAPVEAKQQAAAAAAAVQSRDYPKAFFSLQQLNSRTDLTAEQRAASAESMIAVAQELQQAAQRGDAKAREALEVHRAHK